MSEYVVHLTKGPSARDAFYAILATESSGPRADRESHETLMVSQAAACFSEIPVRMIDRLAYRDSPYGVGFHQEVLVRQRGARVWYVELDHGLATSLILLRDEHAARRDPADPFWDVAPFIERPGTYGNGAAYRFEWEREWRVAGTDMWFAAREIAFMFAPEEEHQALAAWLAGAPVGADRQTVSTQVSGSKSWHDGLASTELRSPPSCVAMGLNCGRLVYRRARWVMQAGSTAMAGHSPGSVRSLASMT